MAPPKILGLCIIPECGKAAVGRGYCVKHYDYWYRHGYPLRLAPIVRLRKRLEAKIMPEPNSGCWLWMGVTAHFGHGVIAINGKKRHAHRIAWEVFVGPIPDGLNVCHKCDIPSCVNPAHLFLGTDMDNFNDMRAKRRHAFGERSGQAKLTERDVRVIRSDARPNRTIATEYGVSGVLIGMIKRGRIWRHIPMDIGVSTNAGAGAGGSAQVSAGGPPSPRQPAPAAPKDERPWPEWVTGKT